MNHQEHITSAGKAKFSAPSIAAVVAAIVSFFVSGGWGLVLAIGAICLGAVGFVMALAPRVRGGLTSMFSLLAGAAGVVVALIKIVVPG